MIRRTYVPLVLALSGMVILVAGPVPSAVADEKKALKPTAEHLKFFETEVLPILKDNCFKCHGGGEKLRGGLRLTSRKGILRGGELGSAVSLEKPAESYLLQAVNYDGLEMPPSGKLAQAKIDTLTKWVELGMPWTPGADADEPDVKSEESMITDDDRAHWSFQTVQRPDVPRPKNGAWIRSPIDAFILKGLEAEQLTPASPAARTELIRRAYYNVIGLPPTLEEVESFVNDKDDNAWEKVVDRLLESPHYGEQWARHWLDLVRYAETNSFERDGAKPYIWRYRDYVIRSLNEDKPYDRFLTEQLAGDELDEVTTETLIATGYYRLGTWDDEPADPALAMYDDLDDIIMTTGQVMIGMTLNCARCHDHKLDPIPQRDYYRFLAFFKNIRRYGVRGNDSVRQASVRSIATEEEKRMFAEELKQHQQQVKSQESRMRALEKLVKKDFIPVEHEEFRNIGRRVDLLKKRVGKLITEEQFKEYQELTKTTRDMKRNPPKSGAEALVVKEKGPEAGSTFVLVRGNPGAHADEVTPGFPEVLGFSDPEIQRPSSGESTGRRRALAEWVTNPRNPLTARVIVNRIWQYHFGRGIVRSTNDFGFQGDAPTHPELLDWLASELVDGDWKLKRLHKLIMMSSTYQMSSRSQPEALAADPENNLFWRFDMRRLTAEEIRDSILAANGQLNLTKMYGPSIYTVIPQEVLAGQSRPGAGWGQSSDEDRRRRSVYIHVKRSLIDPMLASFDFADVDATCPVRFSTTQPTQALGMLNSELMQRESANFLKYLRQNAPEGRQAQVRLALARVFQRKPSGEEVERGLKLIQTFKEQDKLSDDQAMQNFCLLALNLNEFIYID